jgi:hypothetical protein
VGITRHPRRPDIPDLPPGPIEELTDSRFASACKHLIDYGISYSTTKRATLERGWNRATCYNANKQWIRPQRANSGRLWHSWEPIRFASNQAKFPMPTRNYFSPAIQDEVAREIKVGTRPYVRIDDPKKEDGGIIGRQVLLDRNEKTGWDAQDRMGALHNALFGQKVQESYWDLNKMVKTAVAATNAVHCPACNFILASKEVPGPAAQKIGDAAPGSIKKNYAPDKPEVASFEVTSCPSCGGELEGYDVHDQNALDSLDRKLQQEEALGEDLTAIVSPYGFFPQNQGIGYEDDEDMEEYWIRTPRSIPYMQCRYPNAADLKPEMDIEAISHHPVLSSFGLGYSNEKVWDDHVFEDRYVLKAGKHPRFPRGLMIVMAGHKLMWASELLMEGTDVPYHEVHVTQWEQREGEIWGKSMSEDLFSAQDNINSGISIAMDMQYKWVNPKIMIHEGMDLQFSGGASSAYATDIWRLNTRAVPPQIAEKFPHFFGNQGAPGSIFQLYEADREFFKDSTGLYDTETGNVQGAELNYSALVFSAGKSAERRKPRNDGLRLQKRRTMRHRLRMVAARYKEDRLLHFRDDHDKWQVKMFKGLQLENQTDVGLEDDPIVDSGVAERASIEQGINWQIVKTSAMGGSVGTDRRLARAINLPEELSADNNAQDDAARREWRAYTDLEEQEEPVVDKDADNHQIHWHGHTLAMESREAQQLKDRLRDLGREHGVQLAGRPLSWGSVLLATSEWERLHMQMQAFSQVLQHPLAKMPPEQIVAAHGERGAAFAQKVAEARQSLAGWSPVLELQIEECWMRLCEQGGLGKAARSIPQLKTLVRFKAHSLAHWKLLTMPAPGSVSPSAGPGAPAGSPAGGPAASGGAPTPAASPAMGEQVA